VETDASRSNHFNRLATFGFDKGAKFFGRVSDRLNALGQECVLNIRRSESFDNLDIQTPNDVE
jgi:hypothetical protein